MGLDLLAKIIGAVELDHEKLRKTSNSVVGCLLASTVRTCTEIVYIFKVLFDYIAQSRPGGECVVL